MPDEKGGISQMSEMIQTNRATWTAVLLGVGAGRLCRRETDQNHDLNFTWPQINNQSGRMKIPTNGNKRQIVNGVVRKSLTDLTQEMLSVAMFPVERRKD